MAGLKNFCNKISYRHYPCAAATSSSIFEIVVDYTGKENLELSLREFILLDVVVHDFSKLFHQLERFSIRFFAAEYCH